MLVHAKRIELYMTTVYKACDVAIRSLLRHFSRLCLLQMTEVGTHMKIADSLVGRVLLA